MTIRKVPTLDGSDLIFDKFMPARLASGAVAPLVASRVPDANLPDRLGASELSATFAPRGAVADGIRSSLESGVTTACSVFGDSTGNEAGEWVRLLAAELATAYPAHTIHHLLWDDGTQKFAQPDIIQTGTAGPQYMDVALGAADRRLTLAQSPHIAGPIDIRVKLSLPDWTPAAANVLVAREGGSGMRSWYVIISPSGIVQFYYSVDGIALAPAVSSTVAHGIADGATAWIRVVFTPNNGSAQNEAIFYKSSDDGATWTQIGTTVITAGAVTMFNAATPYELGGRQGGSFSGTAKIYGVDIRDGVNGKPIVPRLPALWPPASSGVPPVVGAPVLTFVNCSVSGAGIDYFTGSAQADRRAKMAPDFGQQLAFVSLSHNEGYSYGRGFRARYETLLGELRSLIPSTPFACLTQSPQAAPRDATMIAAQGARRTDIFTVARAAGVAVVDTYGPLLAAGTGVTVFTDGVHPTAAGSLLWKDTIATATGL